MVKGRHLGQAGGGLDYQGLKVGFLGSLAATVGGEAQRPSSGALRGFIAQRPLERSVRPKRRLASADFSSINEPAEFHPEIRRLLAD